MPADDLHHRAQTVLQSQQQMLSGYARHLMRFPSDADDLVQDVCVAVLTNPGLLLGGEDPGAYLRGIARHLGGRQRHRRKREQAIEDVISLVWDAQAASEPEPEQRALSECLAKLPARARELLAYRYEAGLTSQDIAGRTSLTDTAIRMALSRARTMLSRCIRQRLGPAEPALP